MQLISFIQYFPSSTQIYIWTEKLSYFHFYYHNRVYPLYHNNLHCLHRQFLYLLLMLCLLFIIVFIAAQWFKCVYMRKKLREYDFENILHSAWERGTTKVLFILGPSYSFVAIGQGINCNLVHFSHLLNIQPTYLKSLYVVLPDLWSQIFS